MGQISCEAAGQIPAAQFGNIRKRFALGRVDPALGASPAIANQPALLQGARHLAHCFPTDPEHLPHELVREPGHQKTALNRLLSVS